MAWLLIVIILFVLWVAAWGFGVLTGASLHGFDGLLILALLIYFGIRIKNLQAAQRELQEELGRLWKTVKTLQANSVKSSAKAETEHARVASDEKAAGPNTAGNREPEPIAPGNDKEDDYTLVARSNAEPVLRTNGGWAERAVLPVQTATHQESSQDAWLRDSYNPSDATPNALEEWLAGGNWIVRGGLAILFLGLVFLAKFAYENALLPLELRLAAIAAFAVALLVLGWRSRLERPAYGLSLQGGGVAVLYLTIFATSKLTSILPPMSAVALLLLVAVLAAALAVLQDAMALAVIGIIGGFTAPVLMSTGQGSHIALFSYFTALDAGILAVALRKAWRPLNLLAFFFTFGIAGLWGMQAYRPEHQLSCLLFLTLFFVVFITVSLLFTCRQAGEAEDNRAIDASLLFGLPTVTFTYGLYLLRPEEYGGAWLAIVLSGIYLMLAFFVKTREKLAQLTRPWASLSLLFATLAVPLAFDSRLTSSTWALEGAAVVCYGWRQLQTKTRLFGYLLMLLGTLLFFKSWPGLAGSIPVFNASTIGLLVLALAYGVTGVAVNHEKNRLSVLVYDEHGDEAASVSWVMALALSCAGALAIFSELYGRNSAAVAGIAAPLLLWLWALALQWTGKFGRWPQVNAPAVVLPVLALVLPLPNFWVIAKITTPELIFTAFALAAVLIVQAQALKKLLPDLKAFFSTNQLPAPIHALPGITLMVYWWLILMRKASQRWDYDLLYDSAISASVWSVPLAAAAPVALLWRLAGSESGAEKDGDAIPTLWRWLHGGELPHKAVNKQLKLFACLSTAYILIAALFYNGGIPGWPYVPLFNLYELAGFAALFALVRLFRNTPISEGLFGESRKRLLANLGFIFANSILSRVLSNYFDAQFSLGFAWHSAIAATTYSIVWTITALIMMWLASRRETRSLWIAGAVLLGVVAVKLLLIDLSKVGSLARIISFIGVGVLMLVVGYVAPIPSKKTEQVNL